MDGQDEQDEDQEQDKCSLFRGQNRWILTSVGYKTSPLPINFVIHEMLMRDISQNLLKDNPLYIKTRVFVNNPELYSKVVDAVKKERIL